MVLGDQEINKYNQSKMMIATYYTINAMKKGLIDTGMPKTYHMSKRLCMLKKANNFNQTEHAINVYSMQRRIREIGSVKPLLANAKKEKPMRSIVAPNIAVQRDAYSTK